MQVRLRTKGNPISLAGEVTIGADWVYLPERYYDHVTTALRVPNGDPKDLLYEVRSGWSSEPDDDADSPPVSDEESGEGDDKNPSVTDPVVGELTVDVAAGPKPEAVVVNADPKPEVAVVDGDPKPSTESAEAAPIADSEDGSDSSGQGGKGRRNRNR